MHIQKQNPNVQFDTRVGAFIGDVRHSVRQVANFATCVKNKKPIQLEIREDNTYPNYSFKALCVFAPFGFIGMILSGPKKERKKRK